MLTPSELVRYSRHLSLVEVGAAGQERLKQSRIAIVGLGGLGSPAALYLAAAGVGTLGLVEFDRVELANLQRQILHGTSQVGGGKLESARRRLADLNPDIVLEPIEERLTASIAPGLFARFDLILDGTDNFPTRYLINDAAVASGKPYLYGSISRFEGQVAVLAAPGGPCYRCLFPDPPPPGLVPSCGDAGVLGVLPGVIGTLQAVEALKLVLGLGRPLIGRLLSYDALAAEFREWRITRQAACPTCRPGQTAAAAAPGPGGESEPAGRSEVGPRDLADLTGAQIVDVRDEWEWRLGHLPGALHIPLGELPDRLDQLDLGRPVVAVCHLGVRSAVAREILAARGHTALSLRGGLDAWAAEIDPSFPRY